MLCKEEVDKAIQLGWLSEDIYSIWTRKKIDGYYHWEKPMEGYFQSLGIRLEYLNDWVLDMSKDEPQLKDHIAPPSQDTFFVTDYYLICCKGRSNLASDGNGKYVNNEYVYYDPDSIMVIPLNIIEYIRVELRFNYSGYHPGITIEEHKDPARGAMVGALVAGTTGAVIGAAMNSGTKTKTIVRAHAYNRDSYDLCIKVKGMKDNEEYRFECFQWLNHKDDENPFYETNALAQELIERSKLATTIEERKQIVAKTISEGKIVYSETKRRGYLGVIVVGMIMVWIVLTFQSCC